MGGIREDEDSGVDIRYKYYKVIMKLRLYEVVDGCLLSSGNYKWSWRDNAPGYHS